MGDTHFIQREACPACRSKDHQELYCASFCEPPISTYLEAFYSPQGAVEFDYLKEAAFILNECHDCGLIYQRLIPNDFLMRKLYEEWIDPEKVLNWKVRMRGIEYYARLAKEIEMVIRHFGVVPAELEFFDFGMGWGDWCRMARAYGCSASGTELSQFRIESAVRSGISIITWEEIPGRQFDFLNAEQVFEHIANPLETLSYLSQSLKPGGIIKISVPNGSNIKRRLTTLDWTAPKNHKNSLNPVAPLEHINCFSLRSLIRMAQITGLVTVKIQPKITMKQKSLDFTLREVLKPAYRRVAETILLQPVGSTCLFFQKKKS